MAAVPPPPRNDRPLIFAPEKIPAGLGPTPVDEIRNVSTNSTAQWSLNAIELLEMVGKSLPEADPIFRQCTQPPATLPAPTTGPPPAAD